MEAAHTKCKQSLFEGWLDFGRFYFHLCNFCIFKLATVNQKDFVNRTSKCFKSYFLKKCNSVRKMSCDLNFKIVFPRCVCNLSCLTLCNPMDCSPPGFSVHGISQARILEWVAMSSPEDLPDLGLKLTSPALAGRFCTPEPPGKQR